MRFPANRPLRFALQFLPLFALFLWLYTMVLPYYQPAVLGVANTITSKLSPPTRIEIDPSGGWRSYVTESPGEERRLQGWTGFVTHLIYLGLLFLPPLLLATPAPIATRLRLLVLGLALLYVVHVLSIVGLIRGTYCLSASPGDSFCMWLVRLVYVSGQVTGAGLWAALTWRYWVPEDWLRAGEHTPRRTEN